LIVRVKWISKKLEKDKVLNADHPFPYRNNVCQLKEETFAYLKTKFGLQ
jgi:hypothetical protein